MSAGSHAFGSRFAWTLLLSLVALLGGWAIYELGRGRTTRDRSEAAPDSARSLDPAAAFAHGAELVRSGRATDALPFLHRAVTLAPNRGLYQGVYGTALNNASFEQRAHRGLPGPRVRSSWERTRMALESLTLLARAESLAASPEDRERIVRRRAILLANWGFTHDAMGELSTGGTRATRTLPASRRSASPTPRRRRVRRSSTAFRDLQINYSITSTRPSSSSRRPRPPRASRSNRPPAILAYRSPLRALPRGAVSDRSATPPCGPRDRRRSA